MKLCHSAVRCVTNLTWPQAAMETAALPAEQPATRQAIEAKDRSLPGKVTGKLKTALDAMIWEGMKRDDAALHAKLSIHGLREALKRPHVRAYYNSELQVLRESERARSILRMAQLRDQDDNKMVAFNASKELAGGSDDERAASPAMHQAPGVTIKIINVTPQPPAVALDVVPAITHSAASD